MGLWAVAPEPHWDMCRKKYGLGMAAGNPAPIAPVHALGNRQYPLPVLYILTLLGKLSHLAGAKLSSVEGGFHHQYIPSDDHRAAHDPDWRVLVGYSDTDEQAFYGSRFGGLLPSAPY